MLILREISMHLSDYEKRFEFVTSVTRFLFAVDHFVWDYMKVLYLTDRSQYIEDLATSLRDQLALSISADDSGIKRALSQASKQLIMMRMNGCSSGFFGIIKPRGIVGQCNISLVDPKVTSKPIQVVVIQSPHDQHLSICPEDAVLKNVLRDHPFKMSANFYDF